MNTISLIITHNYRNIIYLNGLLFMKLTKMEFKFHHGF